jgi:hypothetical protein
MLPTIVCHNFLLHLSQLNIHQCVVIRRYPVSSTRPGKKEICSIAWLLASVEIERNEKEKKIYTKILLMFRRGRQAQTAG